VNLKLFYYFYLLVLFVVFSCSLYRYKHLDKASRIFSLLIGLTFITETVAYIVARIYRNNMAVYSIFNPVQMFMYSLYFNYAIDVFRKRHIGIYIGIIASLLGLVSILYFQPITHFNSYFLIFEGITVIGMSLFAFFRLLLISDGLILYKYAHFWLMAILVSFWAVTFFDWSMYEYFSNQSKEPLWIVNLFILMENIVSYLAFGFVFLLYPKMNNSHAQ